MSRSLVLPTMEMAKAPRPTAGSVSFPHSQQSCITSSRFRLRASGIHVDLQRTEFMHALEIQLGINTAEFLMLIVRNNSASI